MCTICFLRAGAALVLRRWLQGGVLRGFSAGVGVVAAAGLLTALPYRPFMTVRATSQDKGVLGNLRMYAYAAQQYMLDEGVSQVTSRNILGPGLHISGLGHVADETYALTVFPNTTRLTTTVNARTVHYDF